MAGSVTFTHADTGKVREIVATCTAAADGTFPATALPKFEGRLVAFRSNPGAPAPTDNYDVTLVDGDGVDRLQGVGQNRDTSNSEDVPIVYAGTNQNSMVDRADTLTLTIAGNSVNGGKAVLTFVYFAD